MSIVLCRYGIKYLRRTQEERYMNYTDIECLCVELPEDINKKKWYGDFEGAIRLIDLWLDKDIPDQQKTKLRLEREILKLLPREYTLSFEQAFQQIKDVIPDFTEKEFYELKDHGKIDWMYVNGTERYFRRFLSTLLKVNAQIKQRAKITVQEDEIDRLEKKELLEVIEKMKKNKRVTYHFRLRASVKIEDSSFEPGFVRVHIPIPVKCQQVSNIKILDTSSKNYILADENEPQRTICFEENLTENKEFFVEYEYDNTVYYVEPEEKMVTEINPNEFAHDLREQLPHIMFTPYLKSLAEKLTKDCTNPLAKARSIYDYITNKIEYSFMREYFTIENIPEYAALSGKGDCGVQALLFITLCRIVGIPARWQSGLYTTPYTSGSHDWAQYYIEPYGWLFADCSFGGSAARDQDEERRKFYFANLDPFRTPANSEYQMEFTPAKEFLRADPYDNQRGEVEYHTRGLSYDEFDSEIQVIEAIQTE